jgi:Protein of unknown function (DUF2975)
LLLYNYVNPPDRSTAMNPVSSSPARAGKLPRNMPPVRVLAWLCSALALALPLVTAWLVLHPWPGALVQALAQASGGWRMDAAALSANGLGLAAVAALSMVPVLLMAAALVRASRCLHAFARGEHFTLGAVKELRAFAALVFAAGVACTLVPTVAVLLLSMSGPGPRSLVLSFGSQHLFLLLFSALTWQIAAVLARAVALAEEHAQIV